MVSIKNAAIQKMAIDIQDNHLYDSIYSKQYDKNRKIYFTVTSNGASLDLANCVVYFEMKKKDDTIINKNCEITEDNEIVVELDENITVFYGRMPFQLKIVNSVEQMIITTITGYLNIEESVVKVDDIESSSDFSIYSDILLQITEKYNETKNYAELSKNSELKAKESELATVQSEKNALESQQKALQSENNSKLSEEKSAQSEANSKASEEASKASEEICMSKAEEASQSAIEANNNATMAITKAEEANTSATNAAQSELNAKEAAEQAKEAAEGVANGLQPHGTINYSDLPPIDEVGTGWMYNIADEFITDESFREGSGNVIPLGSNIYKASDNKWDILAGTPVAGVKGDKENKYRRGNVNITCGNIGALAIDGDSQDVITSFTSNDSLNELDSTPPELVVSGESHKSLFSKISTAIKNVRWLLSKIGTTDISSIGDGSITSALSELNTNKQDTGTAITTSNISTQSVNSAKTANSATNATTANTLKANGTDTAMTFNYKASSTNPTYIWGTHLGAANQYVYTPTTIVTAGNGVRSTDGTYYKVSAIQTFKDTDNALLTGSKGNYIFGISSFSDKRLKTNIQDSKVSGLDIINSIHMHSFDFTDDKYGKSKDIGYVAQELKEIVPECVVNIPQDKDEFGFDSLYQVNDTPLIKYLVKAVQELSNEIKELKNK